MAILWMDGFEHYGTGSAGRDNMASYGQYAETTANMTLSTTQARSGTQSVRSSDMKRLFGANLSTVGVGYALWIDSLPSSVTTLALFIFRDNNGNDLASMSISPAGEFILFRGNLRSINYAEIARTAPGLIGTGAWNHLEVKFSPNGATSAIELRMNETTVYSNNSFQCGRTDGQGASATTTASVEIELYGASVTYSYLDDFYAWDTTGSYNNNFIGDKRIATLYPDGDTAEADWTPNSGGTGYTQIDDTTPDNDTTYITSSTVGDISEFNFQAMPTGAVGISALQVITNARKTDAGTADMRTDIVSNVSSTSGVTKILTTAYAMRNDIFETDPNTGALWTKAGLDAAKLKIERVA